MSSGGTVPQSQFPASNNFQTNPLSMFNNSTTAENNQNIFARLLQAQQHEIMETQKDVSPSCSEIKLEKELESDQEDGQQEVAVSCH